MTNDPRPLFRLRYLFNPFYLIRRCRELGSAERILRAAADAARNIRGRCGNAYYKLRGLPGPLKARGHGAYYAARGTLRCGSARLQNAYSVLRGLPLFLRDRAAGLYYKVDAPYYRRKLIAVLSHYRSKLITMLNRRPIPSAPWGPLTLLRPEVLREEARWAEQFRTAQPFKHVVIDGFLDPELCRRLTAEFPPCDAVTTREHGYMETYHENVKELGLSYRKLDTLRRSPDFLRFVSAITGIPDLLYDPAYLGGGAHESLEEMELDPRVDFTAHKKTGLYRRVNRILFLTPEWGGDEAWEGGLELHFVHKKTGLYRQVNLILFLTPEWGGGEAWEGGFELHFNPWLPADKNPIKTISPAFNRCVLFETSDRSRHGYRPIRLPEHKKGLTRRSFVLYLYTRGKSDGHPAIPGDLTLFVNRPLPPEFSPGHRLTEDDVRVLQHLIVRRDWELRYLYDRSISLYNDWQLSQAQLKEALRSLLRRRSIAELFRDLLR